MNTFFCTPISLFLGNPIQIGPIDNNKSPLSSPVLTKKLENTLDRIEDAFKSLPDRPRSASIGNMKKYNSPDLSSPLTISGFVLDKKLQRNVLKFAIFLEYKIVTTYSKHMSNLVVILDNFFKHKPLNF